MVAVCLHKVCFDVYASNVLHAYQISLAAKANLLYTEKWWLQGLQAATLWFCCDSFLCLNVSVCVCCVQELLHFIS